MSIRKKKLVSPKTDTGRVKGGDGKGEGVGLRGHTGKVKRPFEDA